MTRHHDAQPRTCGCTTPTLGGDRTCENCLNLLANALDGIDQLEEELDVSRTRQRGAGTIAGGHSSGETALPYNEQASNAQRRLFAALARWVRYCHDHEVRHSSPTDELPDNTLDSMARWLQWRVDGLASHSKGHRAMLDITKAVEAAERCVFWTRGARLYLGKCKHAPVCDGDVYANEGDTDGICRGCGQAHPVDERRAAMERDLNARLVSAAEFARLATYLGLNESRERIRSRVTTWHHRKRVPAAGHTGTGKNKTPLFQYGALKALLDADMAKRDTPTKGA